MAAPTSSLSTIVTPSSSSLSLFPSEPSFTHFSPSPHKHPKPLFKSLTLTLKPYNLTLSPILHPFHSFSSLNDTAESITNEVEQIPDGIEPEQEQEQDGGVNETEQVDVESGSESDESKGVSSVDERRLFVGNLPYSMTSAQLSDTFSQAGQVQFVEIIYDKVTDRSRGFGFVTMGTAEEAKEAIRMFDGSQVGGRTVRVNFPEVPKGGERKVMGPKIRSGNVSFVDTPHKLYAGNLGWGVTTQGLRDAFANQEGFLSAKVIYERESGKSRGFGFITFSSADAAESALSSMNGMELEGRPLRLNMASEKPRSSTEAYAEHVNS